VNGRQRVVLGGATAALLMVVLGITTNQVLNNSVWSWAWFTAAVACAGATVAVSRRMAALDQPWPVLRLVDENGCPPMLREVTPRQLGVHPSRFGVDGNSPYIERDDDEVLARVLREGHQRLVVVQGPRLAGTTSTLVQAAQTYLPGHRVLVFADDPRFSLAQMVAEGRRWAVEGQGAVLWLDDLNASRLGQLDHPLLDSLPTGLWILATVHDKYLKGFRVPEHVTQLLEEESARVSVGAISAREQDAIRGEVVYADLRAVLNNTDEWLMGRLMVALDQVQDVLVPGIDEESVDRIALLRVVIDWYRLAMPTPLARSVLKDLYARYLREAAGSSGDTPISAARFERTLKWATTGNSRERPQLVDRKETGRTSWYAPNPLLTVIADDTGQPGAWPVGEALWVYADQNLKEDQRRDIGYTALDRGAYPQAWRLLSHDDTHVEAVALHRVAQWLQESGEIDAARLFYGKVIATGQQDQAVAAMVNLGTLEAKHGDVAEAHRWLNKAAATGHPNLAPTAMVNLGTLELEQGDVAEARRWWRDAAATGHPDLAPTAMVSLGTLESEQGDVAEARRWLNKAAATGHPEQAPKAIFSMGMLEAERGNAEAARRWLRKAVATGHPEQAPKAMLELGLIDSRNGNLGSARRWWRDAVATGHPDMAPRAMGNLGVVEYQSGNMDEARRWWREAAATSDPEDAPKAMVLLGVLEAQQDNAADARRWLNQAIATGHPDHASAAMVDLGVLESTLHNVDMAHRWLEKAIATGHPDHAPAAMVNLAVLEMRMGNLEEARRWLGMAIASGQPEAKTRAERELRELDRHAEDLRQAGHFAQYDWQAHADPRLMKPDDPVQKPKKRAKPSSPSRRRRPR
jgi:TPR repeat protein